MNWFRPFAGPSGRMTATLLAAILAGSAGQSRGIEMFTFFGDGSRIGLPSLEVPVEAYPGIPLRSDRLRARRRAMRPTPPPRSGQLPAGVTIRSMPGTGPVPRHVPVAPQRAIPRSRDDMRPTAATPVAPSPEEVVPPRGEER